MKPVKQVRARETRRRHHKERRPKGGCKVYLSRPHERGTPSSGTEIQNCSLTHVPRQRSNFGPSYVRLPTVPFRSPPRWPKGPRISTAPDFLPLLAGGLSSGLPASPPDAFDDDTPPARGPLTGHPRTSSEPSDGGDGPPSPCIAVYPQPPPARARRRAPAIQHRGIFQ